MGRVRVLRNRGDRHRLILTPTPLRQEPINQSRKPLWITLLHRVAMDRWPASPPLAFLVTSGGQHRIGALFHSRLSSTFLAIRIAAPGTC